MSARPLSVIGDNIADPALHVGGGSAAAAAASLAAASADLVVFLSDRKSTPSAVSQKLQADHERLTILRADLMEAGDVDENVLDQLMHSYRKRSDDQVERLIAAAASSLTIARLSVEIIDIVETNIEHASRFTVSDLGTAATLAASATEAALLNATINVTMLEGSNDPPLNKIEHFRRETTHLREHAAASSARTLAAVWKRIDPVNQVGS